MKQAFKKIGLLITATAAIGWVGVVPANALSDTDSNEAGASSDWVFVAGNLDEIDLDSIPAQSASNPDELVEGEQGEGGEITPFIFLDPYQTLQCRNGNTNFVVEIYFDYNLGNDVDMHCGTATGFGWLHIEKEHYSQWQGLLDDCNAVGGCGWGFAWDDIMDLATSSSLEAATQVVHRASNSTVCYSVPFHLINKQTGQVVRTVYTRTVITTNRAGTDADPQRLITSFFTSSSAGCYA